LRKRSRFRREEEGFEGDREEQGRRRRAEECLREVCYNLFFDAPTLFPPVVSYRLSRRYTHSRFSSLIITLGLTLLRRPAALDLLLTHCSPSGISGVLTGSPSKTRLYGALKDEVVWGLPSALSQGEVPRPGREELIVSLDVDPTLAQDSAVAGGESDAAVPRGAARCMV
jgi:hypothetical protein